MDGMVQTDGWVGEVGRDREKVDGKEGLVGMGGMEASGARFK